MTEAEKNLLLAVARILRAKISNEVYAEREDDLWALNEALAPFDPNYEPPDPPGWEGGFADNH